MFGTYNIGIYQSVAKLLGCSSRETLLALKVLLIACTLVHDMVQATVVTSYCLQAQLLQAHLMFLKERLLNRTITPLNWMRVNYHNYTI